MQTKNAIPTRAKKDAPLSLAEIDAWGAQSVNASRSSHEDIDDAETAWLESVDTMAAAVCKDKTDTEIFRHVGSELSKMGVSSVFFIGEPGAASLTSASVTIASGGVPIIEAVSDGSRNISISTRDNEIISRVLSLER
jgi:hypothetical protein